MQLFVTIDKGLIWTMVHCETQIFNFIKFFGVEIFRADSNHQTSYKFKTVSKVNLHFLRTF